MEVRGLGGPRRGPCAWLPPWLPGPAHDDYRLGIRGAEGTPMARAPASKGPSQPRARLRSFAATWAGCAWGRPEVRRGCHPRVSKFLASRAL